MKTLEKRRQLTRTLDATIMLPQLHDILSVSCWPAEKARRLFFLHAFQYIVCLHILVVSFYVCFGGETTNFKFIFQPRLLTIQVYLYHPVERSVAL